MAPCSLPLLALLAAGTGVGALNLTHVRPHHRHHPPAAAVAGASSGECGCQNWKQTYLSGLISCGDGQEFFFKTGKSKPEPAALQEAKDALGAAICTRFYETLNNNHCVNLNIGKDRGQWCYVDASCGQLGGGGAVPGTQYNWKLCQQGVDPMFRDFQPRELYGIALRDDVELGLLHKLAYPLSKAMENKRFPEVQAFWGIGGTPESMPPWLAKDMQKIADSGKPYSFDNSLDERCPHTIVMGTTVYSVVDSPRKEEAHPGTWEELTCVSGNC